MSSIIIFFLLTKHSPIKIGAKKEIQTNFNVGLSFAILFIVVFFRWSEGMTMS